MYSYLLNIDIIQGIGTGHSSKQPWNRHCAFYGVISETLSFFFVRGLPFYFCERKRKNVFTLMKYCVHCSAFCVASNRNNTNFKRKNRTQHKITRIEYNFFSFFILHLFGAHSAQCLQLLEPHDVKMFTCLCNTHLQFKRLLMFRFVLLFLNEREKERKSNRNNHFTKWIDGHNWFTCKSQCAHPKKWFTHARSGQKQLRKLKQKWIIFFFFFKKKKKFKYMMLHRNQILIYPSKKQHQDF